MVIEPFRSAIRMKPREAFTIRAASGESDSVTQPESVWQSPEGNPAFVDVRERAVALIGVDRIADVVHPGKKSKSEA